MNLIQEVVAIIEELGSGTVDDVIAALEGAEFSRRQVLTSLQSAKYKNRLIHAGSRQPINGPATARVMIYRPGPKDASAVEHGRRDRGRPIGKRVIEAMEILERLGEATYTEVWEHMQDVCVRENASKYMVRSVEYGLAERVGGKPVKYRPVRDWRRWLTESPTERHSTPAMPRVNSVWQLGSLA